LIGITAVDGRGTPFRAGGRVVKNVAGYDFCKLLTGSLGTLGVITQLVFKVKPRPAAEALLVVPCSDFHQAERALDALSRQAVTPCIVDLLVGSGWVSDEWPESKANAWLVIGVEGTTAEVNWMTDELTSGFRNLGMVNAHRLIESQLAQLRNAITEFSDRGPTTDGDGSPLATKAIVPPSATVEMVRMLLAHDPNCTIQCHAGSGIVLARFSEFTASDLTRQLIGKFRPAAIQRGGSLIVVSSTIEGLTPPIIWGGRTTAHGMVDRVKQAFDPHGILNPGRMN
jgi:glycolate oxidase FAD binding subunit